MNSGQSLFLTHRSLAPAPVSPVRATLRWQLSRAEFFLLGPVSFHDLRTVELPRKSTRHRCLPALARTSAPSSGNPRQNIAQHAGRCQRVTRLEDLRRLRPRIDPRSAAIVSQRRPGAGSGQHGLCAGFHDYRSVHGAVSVGTFFLDPTRSETTYAAGPARPDSCFPAHYTGTHPRRQHSRPAYSRGGRFLRDGSWLSQFRTVVSLDLAGRLLLSPEPARTSVLLVSSRIR